MISESELLQDLANGNPCYRFAREVFDKMRAKIAGEFHQWATIEVQLNKMGYFYLPASTKNHLSAPGGLLMHSVGVAMMMERMLGCTTFKDEIPLWELFVVGLLHDVGKCGVMVDGVFYSRYKLRDQLSCEFTYCKAPLEFQTRDLSALMVAKWGLNTNIQQAVLCHDGPYVDANRVYSHKLSPLTMLTQTADTWCGQVEESKDSSRLLRVGC